MNNDDLIKQAQVLYALGKMEKPELPETGPLPGSPPAGHVFCGGRPQGCSKVLHESEVPYHWTGIVRARDTLCRECQALVPNHALIVCLRCCAVVARIPPHTFPDGFRIEPRRTYHIQYCGNFDCRPDLPSSRIIEGELHRKDKK